MKLDKADILISTTVVEVGVTIPNTILFFLVEKLTLNS